MHCRTMKTKTVFGHVFETDIVSHIAVKFKALSLITKTLLHITLQERNCIQFEFIISFFCIYHTKCHRCALEYYDT
jgi:hypothetical protein